MRIGLALLVYVAGLNRCLATEVGRRGFIQGSLLSWFGRPPTAARARGTAAAHAAAAAADRNVSALVHQLTAATVRRVFSAQNILGRPFVKFDALSDWVSDHRPETDPLRRAVEGVRERAVRQALDPRTSLEAAVELGEGVAVVLRQALIAGVEFSDDKIEWYRALTGDFYHLQVELAAELGLTLSDVVAAFPLVLDPKLIFKRAVDGDLHPGGTPSVFDSAFADLTRRKLGRLRPGLMIAAEVSAPWYSLDGGLVNQSFRVHEQFNAGLIRYRVADTFRHRPSLQERAFDLSQVLEHIARTRTELERMKPSPERDEYLGHVSRIFRNVRHEILHLPELDAAELGLLLPSAGGVDAVASISGVDWEKALRGLGSVTNLLSLEPPREVICAESLDTPAPEIASQAESEPPPNRYFPNGSRAE